MSDKMRVQVIAPQFANFLKYNVLGGEERFSVGELSQADAAMLWDEWKPLWLAHVKKRSTGGESASLSEGK